MTFKQEVVKAALPVITYFEGFKAKPYYCPAGILTVAYGFTYPSVSKADLNRTWTLPEANAKLEQLLLDIYYPALTKVVTERTLERIGIYRAASLLSAVFNLGASGVFAQKFLSRVQKLDASYLDLANHLRLYNKAGKVVLKGLVRRRNAEAYMLEYNKPFNPTLV